MKIIKYDEDDYGWQGSVDLGILGVFSDDMIHIDIDCCDIAGVEDNMSEEEKLIRVSDYYARRFEQLTDAKDALSEQFMMWMVTHLSDIEYPFWEKDEANQYPSYIKIEEIRKYEDANGDVLHDPYQPSPIYSAIAEYNVYENPEHLKSYEIAEKFLPVLNFLQMVKTIEAGALDTYEECVHFEVGSEICGGMLFCATYGKIDGNNILEVTNNC